MGRRGLGTMPSKGFIFPDQEALILGAAERISRAVRRDCRRSGRCALGLSGGSTPRGVYEALSRPPFSGLIPWTRLDLFFSDERCVPPEHPESNFRMAWEALLSKVTIPEFRIHRMRAEQGPERSARDYEAELRRVLGPRGRLDILLLGVGEDGHTASLFPGSAALQEERAWTAPARSPDGQDRVTLTLPFINRSSRIMVLACGQAKAGVLRKIFSSSAEAHPARRISRCRTTWLLDAEAAGQTPVV